MKHLPEAYIARLRGQWGEEAFAAYIAAMEAPPARGLRVNTLKIGVEAFCALSPWQTAPSGIIPQGLLLTGEAARVGAHPLHRAGLFYMQEPSAMLPAALLAVRPGMRVLDACAAPGGKAGQLAEALNGEGVLVANEVVPRRAAILQGNLERLGVRNAIVSSLRPDAIAQRLPGWFDAVLVDAPCSGEGMFRKEPQAAAEWSPAHVTSCAKRQRAILHGVAPALRPGGRLVYATCTFSGEENEDTVRAFLRDNPDFQLLKEHRLYPHTSPGEGQYAALLQRCEGDAACAREERMATSAALAVPPVARMPHEAQKAWEKFLAETFAIPPAGRPLLLPDGRVWLLFHEMPPACERLRPRVAGVIAGEYRNGRILPAHALCMAYSADCFRHKLELDNEELEIYFQGNIVKKRGLAPGYLPVCAQGYPVGWGKAVGDVVKNHLPKGLRG